MTVSASDTWGISGPTFLASLLILAVFALAATLVLRTAAVRAPEPGVSQPPLTATDVELQRRGLLVSAEQARAVRRAAWPLAAVLALGVLRLIAGIRNDKPVGLLVVLLILVGVLTAALVLRIPRRTDAGDDALAHASAQYAYLAPSLRPDFGVYGAPALAIAVGLYGAGALMAADPAFAASDAVRQQVAAASGFGGGWSGGGDGGGSSCGGSSSCGSGSSCGGGGGCGG